ncbi:hypothetical protein [Pseudomonas syringae]|uniref:Uncharacterized protein n=1 Tax=Pseudomonas syringae TaxID=317 RepID=A0A085V561_PSESX|nr:hypothetical protein [Pseudomonas syringae]KFE50574.1 hypothetical protein IV01_24945 [Pseudomonas syringae]
MSTPDHQMKAKTESAALPTKDASGKLVDVVERDLGDERGNTEQVDKVITPSSTRAKEQDAENLRKKNAEVEEKLAEK